MNIQRIERAASIIADYLATTPTASLNDVISQYEEPLSRARLTDEEAGEVYTLVQRELAFRHQRDHAEVEDPAVVLNGDPTIHVPWYDEWLQNSSHDAYYWPHLEAFVGSELRGKLGDEAAGRIIRSMDNATNSIVQLMEAPTRPGFATKGLVVGFVQSGKTANFTALIAKALDAGYKLVVVLTGTHDILRKQTQQRLDRELTGEIEVDDLTHVTLPVAEHRRFMRLTTRDHDFKAAGHSSLETLSQYRNPILCVMKKNPAVMRRFRDWVRRAPAHIRTQIPVLLIDDEADLAGVDTNANRPGFDPTATNATIREILGLFQRNAYIGYTATPFANILIDYRTDDADLGHDLYPRNFVVSLPRPEGYFGAEQVFQRPNPNPFVREVPAAEVAVVSTGRRAPLLRGIPDCLQTALDAFLLGGASRLHRGHAEKPMTMLVHTSQSQAAHGRLKELLDQAVEGMRTSLADRHEQVNIYDRLRQLWETDFHPTSLSLSVDFNNPVHSFDEIRGYINPFLNELQTFELNSNSFDDLDYTVTPNIKALAVGGNKLSRGLTLEGLMASYYLRESKAYDTLLQMGRWFGYRQGYEDLTRVYTSDRLHGWFSALATVENELREAIRRYEDEGLTPLDVAVRIRAHSQMQITSPRKMGAGMNVTGSFSKTLAQTLWFPLSEPQVLQANLDATGRFVTSLATFGSPVATASGPLFTGIDGRDVLSYLEAYRFVPQRDGGGPSLDSEELIRYITRRLADGELRTWNVLVKSQQPGQRNLPPTTTLGSLTGIIPVVRNRQVNTEYKVGVISDPPDLVADLPQGTPTDRNRFASRQNPLLILYPIWEGSQPRVSRNLTALFEGLQDRRMVIGLAIDFPESRLEPQNYVAQPIA